MRLRMAMEGVCDDDSMLAMLAEGVKWRNVKFRRGMSPDCANYNRFRRLGEA